MRFTGETPSKLGCVTLPRRPQYLAIHRCSSCELVLSMTLILWVLGCGEAVPPTLDLGKGESGTLVDTSTELSGYDCRASQTTNRCFPPRADTSQSDQFTSRNDTFAETPRGICLKDVAQLDCQAVMPGEVRQACPSHCCTAEEPSCSHEASGCWLQQTAGCSFSTMDCSWTDLPCLEGFVQKTCPEEWMWRVQLFLGCLADSGFFADASLTETCIDKCVSWCSDEIWCELQGKPCPLYASCCFSCEPGAGESACVESCAFDTTLSAVEWSNTYDACLSFHGLGLCAHDDWFCQFQAIEFCGDVIASCFEENLSCKAVNSCFQNCDKGETACLLLCQAQGAVQAREQFAELAECLWLNCDGFPSGACWEAGAVLECGSLLQECDED